MQLGTVPSFMFGNGECTVLSYFSFYLLILVCFFEKGSCFVVSAGLRLEAILLTQSPKCSDCRRALSLSQFSVCVCVCVCFNHKWLLDLRLLR